MNKSEVLALFRKEAKFVAGADKPQRLPKLHLPEFAFVGKSNVGKSSLINKLCNRKGLAKVSVSPGRTQQINFFELGGKLTLVDLPGYGYAKVPQNMRSMWEELILHYLSKRSNLKIVNLLIDARRGVAENDLKIVELLISLQLNFQIVFTKSDKISNTERIELTKSSGEIFGGRPITFIFTSSRSGNGTEELQLSLAKHL
ncbi:MAG: YihA family ribosome biogenesis GTP-binding protein [Rickettsiaceae bacterium]|nr:YihA family ribosome biogenesis GTP-binding protein [Rickettsiaceae bacterium]